MIPRSRLLFLCLVFISLFLTFRYLYRNDRFSSSTSVPVELNHGTASKPIAVPPAGDVITVPSDPKIDDKPPTEPLKPIPGEPDTKAEGPLDSAKEGVKDGGTGGGSVASGGGGSSVDVHDDLKGHKPEDKGLGAMKPKPIGENENDSESAKPTGKHKTVSEEDREQQSDTTNSKATTGEGAKLDADEKWAKKTEARVNEAIEAHKKSPKDIKALGSRTALLAELYDKHAKTGFTSDILSKLIPSLQGTLFPWLAQDKFSYEATVKMMGTVSQGKGKRGLVIPVSQAAGSHGGARLAAHLIITIRKLLKSKIPIEIIYMGDTELRSDTASRLKSLAADVKLVDMQKGAFFDNSYAGLPNKYATKSFAILASSFDEVIVADQDVVFFEDPMSAFESDEYVSTGTIFYHARGSMNPADAKKEEHKELIAELDTVLKDIPTKNYKQNSRFFNTNDLDKMSGNEMDPGVIVLDKRRVWSSLLLTAALNAKPLRDDWTYDRMKTDTETYWLAMLLSRTPYNFTSSYAGDIGTAIHPAANGGPDVTHSLALNRTHLHAYELGHYLCDLHAWHPLDSKRREIFWMSGSLYKDRTKRDPVFLESEKMGYVEMTQGDEGFGSGKEPQICLGGNMREVLVLGVTENNVLKEMVETVKGKVEVKRWQR